MTKTQKVWLWVFIAMFIVPEALWSPVGNTIYSLFQSGKRHPEVLRANFLFNYQYENLLKLIVVVQFIGVTLSLFYLIKYRKSISTLIFFLLFIINFLLFIITALVFYLLIIFNPSFP